MNFLGDNQRQIVDEEYFSLKNAVWSGCHVKNNEIIGLVIAVGQETRLAKNSSNKKYHKQTLIDQRINLFSIILFLMMLTVSLLNAILSGSSNFGFQIFMVSVVRYVILLSFLIPISLKLFLIGGRLFYSGQITNDSQIKGV